MKYVNMNYSNRQIHLGLVERCNKDERFGLLYGIQNSQYRVEKQIYENKLVYFEKDVELEIAEDTLVSYLSYDYNEFTPKVEYVYPVNSLVIHRDERSIHRADRVYHDDETWKLINDGIPYFDYEPSREYCIYYPIIKDDLCKIWSGLFGCGIYMRKEAIIYEMYKELTTINYSGWPTLDETTNAIVNFKRQIDSINAFEMIDTFEIVKIGRYISRPGRDDHYFEDLYQNLPNDDKFLSYLLPTKQKNIFCDYDASRSDGYREGVLLLDDETKQARDKAKAEYSKEKHLAFLVNDYFSEVLSKKERSEFLSNRIHAEFDVNNAYEIASQFNGEITDEFIALINQYNESTVTGHI